MGLDIFAASHLRYVGPMPSPDELDEIESQLLSKGQYLHDRYEILSPDDDFPDHLTGMSPGLYEQTAASENYGFRAGSYSSYNWWREQLADFAHGVDAATIWGSPEDYEGKPFVELINFSDCGGAIGTVVAKKLAKDFQEHTSRAEEFVSSFADTGEGNYWIENYKDFARAFALAAQDGALDFH